MQKTEMDIERLLVWAFVDELPKKHTSAAEGIWDRIFENQHHGGIDRGHSAAQRYAHFGLPDPDAEAIERAVDQLEDLVINWELSFDAIAADLSALVTINDMSGQNRSERKTKVGWGRAGDRALKAFFGPPGSERPAHDAPRDVMMVGGFKTSVLVKSWAIKNGRPDWWDEQPRPGMQRPATGGANPTIIGECRGKNLYTTGSCCPLSWNPSPLAIVTARAEYATWYQGLMLLAQTLQLKKFVALPPKAPATPWIDDSERASRVIPVVPNGKNDVSGWGKLPLTPLRGRRERSAQVVSSI